MRGSASSGRSRSPWQGVAQLSGGDLGPGAGCPAASEEVAAAPCQAGAVTIPRLPQRNTPAPPAPDPAGRTGTLAPPGHDRGSLPSPDEADDPRSLVLRCPGLPAPPAGPGGRSPGAVPPGTHALRSLPLSIDAGQPGVTRHPLQYPELSPEPESSPVTARSGRAGPIRPRAGTGDAKAAGKCSLDQRRPGATRHPP